MAVIAVYSVKGGVGKTTLAVDLAWRSAALSGHRTLLWDLDPQGGAGYLLGFDETNRQRAAAIFQREGKPREVIEPTRYERLSLLPADESLRSLPVQLARIGHRKRLATMATYLKPDFDRIILDCPAGFGEVADQVLSAADLVIVPLPPSPLSARALEMIRRELIRNHHRHPPVLPVLSMVDTRRRLHREVVEGIGAGWPQIGYNSLIEQTAVQRAPLSTFAPYSDPARSLKRLWNGIEAKLASMRAQPERGTAGAFSLAQARTS